MEILEPILYLIAFALFIYGLMGLTGPRTAVRGNWIAAVGMAIAMLTALLELMLNEGELSPDWDDEVLAKSCVTRDEPASNTETASEGES